MEEKQLIKTLGIVAEYNPFHNGHRYHLHAAQKRTQVDAVMVLMSGAFVQRGTPACADKWQRAEWAVAGGADLVCELPTIFACARAESFAAGAVAILNACRLDTLAFGVETDDLPLLQSLAHYLAEEPSAFRRELADRLAAGIGFAAARSQAIQKILGEDAAALLRYPNNILAIEYLKAIRQQTACLCPIPVPRLGSAHHNQNTDGNLLSGSAIRNALCRGDDKTIAAGIPYDIEHLTEDHYPQMRTRYQRLVVSKLITADLEQLRNLPEVREGLEFSLQNALAAAPKYEAIIDRVSSKRIPKSRVRRILAYLALNISRQTLMSLQTVFVPYLRVLAFNRRGQQLLAQLRNQCSLPILTNLRSNQTRLSPTQRAILDLDVRAQDLWNMLADRPIYHKDYLQNPKRY
ncbi:tRNA(Met) cytidine acetate ligase [Pseudoramibacter alactolyticus]